MDKVLGVEFHFEPKVEWFKGALIEYYWNALDRHLWKEETTSGNWSGELPNDPKNVLSAIHTGNSWESMPVFQPGKKRNWKKVNGFVYICLWFLNWSGCCSCLCKNRAVHSVVFAFFLLLQFCWTVLMMHRPKWWLLLDGLKPGANRYR